MKAAELYRVLEKELGPPLTARGFKKIRRSRLTFQQSIDDKYHSVWFQCDKYGWDSHSGGKFYVNFTVSISPDPEDPERREERLNFFLSDIELRRALNLQNGIIARIPKPPESYFQGLQAGFSKSTSSESAASLVKTIRGYFEPESEPFRRTADFSLRYWRPDDVVSWTQLIASVIPRALEEMQVWTIPARRSH
jgi:hypothetical protein